MPISKENKSPTLANADTFSEQTEHLLEFSTRTQAKASMLFITFEAINTQLNEQQSELVIQAISQVLLSKARESDIYAHLDGMNFANLSVDTSEQHAKMIASKLKTDLAQPLLLTDGTHLTLRTKIGSASFPAQGNNYTQLISSAKSAAH